MDGTTAAAFLTSQSEYLQEVVNAKVIATAETLGSIAIRQLSHPRANKLLHPSQVSLQYQLKTTHGLGSTWEVLTPTFGKEMSNSGIIPVEFGWSLNFSLPAFTKAFPKKRLPPEALRCYIFTVSRVAQNIATSQPPVSEPWYECSLHAEADWLVQSQVAAADVELEVMRSALQAKYRKKAENRGYLPGAPDYEDLNDIYKTESESLPGCGQSALAHSGVILDLALTELKLR